MDYHGQNAFEVTYFNCIVSDFENRYRHRNGKEPDEFTRTYIEFCTAGIVRTVSQWLKSDCEKDPEELTGMLRSMIPSAVLEYID